MKKISTFLICILAFIMLALWIKYISLRFDVEKNSPELDSEYWIFTGTADANVDIIADEYFFSPLSVSLVLSGEGHTSAYNPELTSILYKNHKPLIKEILSSSYVCSPSDINRWNQALSGENLVMIEYPTAFPYTVIALFCEKTDSFPEGEISKIKSLLLFSDEKGNLTALSKDGGDKVFSYTLKDPSSPSIVYDFNSNNLAAYTVNIGFTDFVFNFNLQDGQKNENLPPEYKLLSSSPVLEGVKADFPLKNIASTLFSYENSQYNNFDTNAALAALFDVFEINPNIVGYYSDPVSGSFFVGQEMTLFIDVSGTVEYSATEKAIAPVTVASLLNSERNSFSTNELITAATAFLGKLPNTLIGEGALPVLDGISYSVERSETTLRFSYYYKLSEVLKDGEKVSFTLTFSDNALVKAVFTPLVLTPNGKEAVSGEYLDMSLTPDVVLKMLNNNGEFAPVYNITEDESVLPLWMEKSNGGNTKQ
ncbi:MAG: hypothetical protein IJ323_03005 [Clostridia bacterium]|nr:hypothetical protein [Clostridia bacterium]